MVKHNKKRNTAFLYEILVKELASAIIETNAPYRAKIMSLLKEFFNNKTILGRELECYKNVYLTENVSDRVAEQILLESIQRHNKLSKRDIFNSQTKLIKKINDLDSNIFNVFLKEYRILASVNQLFSDKGLTVPQAALLRESLLGIMVAPKIKEQSKLENIDSITFNSFLKKFNEKYGDQLLEEQKEALGTFILSGVRKDISFKYFLYKEIPRLKTEVKNSFEMKEIKEDLNMMKKTEEVLLILEEMKDREVDEELLADILNIQSLVAELKI